jgi:hypothetical protein
VRVKAALLLLIAAALLAFASASYQASSASSHAQSTLPKYEELPATGETYPGSGTYLVGPLDAMNAAVQAEQGDMAVKKVDVGRLVGLRVGDVEFTLKNGKGKRAVFYERGAYHELDGKVALGSLVLTALKDGRIILGSDPNDYYALTQSQHDYLLLQPVTGEGGATALTFYGLLSDAKFGGVPILNTDPQKATEVTTKYEGRLVTQGFALTVEVRDLDDPNFLQEMLPPNPATGMRLPKGAYDALLRMFNNDEGAIVRLVGYPVSPYFVMESQVKGVLKKVGVVFTERQVLTYNPDNDEANRWEIGLFGARVFGAIKDSPAPATPIPTSTSAPSPTPLATLGPVDPINYKIPGREWRGGYSLGLPTSDGQGGFRDAVNGPLLLDNELYKMIIAQTEGRYGSTPDELNNFLLNHDGIIPDFVYPVSDGDSARVPPWVKPSAPVTLDLKKPIKLEFRRADPPAGNVLRIGASDYWTSIGVEDGQLVIAEQSRNLLPLYILGAFSVRTNYLMEATARIKTAQDYPRNRPDDFFSVILKQVGDGINNRGRGPLVLNCDVFYDLSDDGKSYASLFGKR